MFVRQVCVGVLSLALVATHSRSALALTDEERSAARAAATQGADAFDAGNWAEAVDLFSRAEALVHSPAHLLYIARSQIKLGQWVKAYEALQKVKREQLPANASPAVKRAVDEAAKELAQLEPQLPYVATKIKNPSGDVQVLVDGTALPPLMVGLLRPMDPGSHQFQAKSGALASEVVTLEVKPASKQTVELELKSQSSAPAVPPPSTPPPSTPPPADVSVSTADTSGTNPKRIAAYGALGLGAVGLGVGTLFLVKAGSTQSEADDLCPSEPCPASAKSEIDSKDSDAASQRTLAFVGYGVGVVGIGAGITLWLLSNNDSKSAKNEPRVVPYFGFQSAGVTGRF